MVNAPQMWRERRKREIALIQNSIREAVINGTKPDYNKLLLAAMANLGISKTRAKEYVEVALYNEGIELPKDNQKSI